MVGAALTGGLISWRTGKATAPGKLRRYSYAASGTGLRFTWWKGIRDWESSREHFGPALSSQLLSIESGLVVAQSYKAPVPTNQAFRQVNHNGFSQRCA